MKVLIVKNGKEYGVGFNQGNQFFSLRYAGQRKEAKWMAKMLRNAFKNYKEEILSTK